MSTSTSDEINVFPEDDDSVSDIAFDIYTAAQDAEDAITRALGTVARLEAHPDEPEVYAVEKALKAALAALAEATTAAPADGVHKKDGDQ